MKKFFVSSICLGFMLSVPMNALSADWRLWEMGDKECKFYDLSSAKRNKENVTVWSASFDRKKIKSYMNDAAKAEANAVADKIASKKLNEGIPAYLRTTSQLKLNLNDKKKNELAMSILDMELAVNSDQVEKETTMLSSFNCKYRTYSILSASEMKNGKQIDTKPTTEVKDVPPETRIEDLYEILCKPEVSKFVPFK